ncbi:VOC family protein [Parasediminibacterium paludis]|uniref:VOC family protein n=1 Tax=Parasediminibacterium paludis TaxID=908966 RepID=A0ABV8PYR7_9BACT
MTKKQTLTCSILLLITTSILGQNKTNAKINHTAVYVVNLAASKHFYQDIIGLDTIPEPFHDGKHAWFKTGAGIAMHVIQGAESKKDYYKNQHTCFSVDSVKDFTEVLKKNNISWENVNGIKEAITIRVDGVQQIWLQDPDGYWVEINDAKD